MNSTTYSTDITFLYITVCWFYLTATVDTSHCSVAVTYHHARIYFVPAPFPTYYFLLFVTNYYTTITPAAILFPIRFSDSITTTIPT